MPKIFSSGDMEKIRQNLLQLGAKALETQGYKAIHIEHITNRAGIAKGTFYHFFSSKEAFFYQVMCFIRGRNRDILEAFIADKPGKTEVAAFLYQNYLHTKHLYHYFSDDEVRIIFRKMPEKLEDAGSNSMEYAAALLTRLPGSKQNIDTRILVNLLIMLGDFTANADMMAAGGFKETVRFMADAIASYIFEGGE